jgi:hypothetical protein
MQVKSRPLEGVLVAAWIEVGKGGQEGRGNAPNEPDEAFSRSVLLGLELVDDEVLEGL